MAGGDQRQRRYKIADNLTVTITAVFMQPLDYRRVPLPLHKGCGKEIWGRLKKIFPSQRPFFHGIGLFYSTFMEQRPTSKICIAKTLIKPRIE
ncbi:hypothetical protein SY85_09945 [Flavisolibacter tropicus]|uniref:Uncharacterized protein n=1 Tax=Flavisolibacter tropicus TaxID=1492898 RepID=A0A172TUK6_9BACT|nr:hypothetical protein SY85_09945 [Flavisolibacter tropicus]